MRIVHADIKPDNILVVRTTLFLEYVISGRLFASQILGVTTLLLISSVVSIELRRSF